MFDFAGTGTGPGTVTEQVDRKNGIGIKVIVDLGNFNISGNTLKPAGGHKV